ncbi:MAG TPA: glycosyltransferase family 4 protein [Candidatus Acidoferrales bacterium]|nr:glycosyltransferase family 4 protein [Candidatus Acidoferrales bacterium]
MSAVGRKPRLAVVSPFLDKRHGTERIVVEWISRLTEVFEIHVYSQELEGLDLHKITWHRISKLPGPHLFNFLWWFAANHCRRAWDRTFRGLRQDVVFTPGTNCLDADVISVHIVFAEFLRRAENELTLGRNPWRSWPRLVHRRIYYRLVIALEGRVYRKAKTILVLLAQKTANDLTKLYERRNRMHVLYPGLDHSSFNRDRRAALRGDARTQLELPNDRIAALMVGNDWRKKGIRVLLDAMTKLRDLPVDLLLVGEEDPQPFLPMVNERNLNGRVRFLPPRKDVEFYYAAADVYAGPSLEDTGPLPPVEAMACGVPAILSASCGTAEIITDGVNGLILDDPTDAASLAAMIRRLCEDRAFREHLGQNAAAKAREFTWERNGQQLTAIFEESMRQKKGRTSSAKQTVR